MNRKPRGCDAAVAALQQQRRRRRAAARLAAVQMAFAPSESSPSASDDSAQRPSSRYKSDDIEHTHIAQSMHSSLNCNMMRHTLLALLAAGVYVVEAASPCLEGWRYFPVTNSCYKLIDDELPWTLAEFKCLFQGAHHASIESAAENQFVHELARHGEMWTGAALFGSSTVYVNTDQTPYGAYSNWQGGVTPPINRARRCIKMDRNGEWYQSCCKKRSLAVCEKRPSYSWELTNDLSEFRRAKFRRF